MGIFKMAMNRLRWSCLTVLLALLSVNAMAQTWLPAPAQVPCASLGIVNLSAMPTVFNPSPIEAGKPYIVGTLGGNAGKLQNYYFELIGNELRLHLQTTQAPFNVITGCYALPNPPLLNIAGTYFWRWFEYDNINSVTPFVYRSVAFDVVQLAPTPANSNWSILLIFLGVAGLAVRRLKASAVLVICFLAAPPLWRIHI
jgi:hypothetical protein